MQLDKFRIKTVGRPYKEEKEKKKIKVSTYIKEDIMEDLEIKLEDLDISMADYLRNLIRNDLGC